MLYQDAGLLWWMITWVVFRHVVFKTGETLVLDRSGNFSEPVFLSFACVGHMGLEAL